MTANELFNQVLAVMSENKSNSSGYSEFFVGMTNQVMAELFPMENSYRQSLGLDGLKEVPVITKMEDVIPYQDNIVRNVMVWGIATLLALGDEENMKAGFYDNKYQTNRNQFNRANYVPIDDVYGGGEW